MMGKNIGGNKNGMKTNGGGCLEAKKKKKVNPTQLNWKEAVKS